MTTVLTPEEIMLPTTRRPNKVELTLASRPVGQRYVIGQPWLSVDHWTPYDHYAGPAPIVGRATPAWARKTIKSSEIPILSPSAAEMACRDGESGPIYRDFYSGAPTNFWPCTRTSMSNIGMNRTLKVIPVLSGLEDTSITDRGRAGIAAVAAGIAGFFITKAILQSR